MIEVLSVGGRGPPPDPADKDAIRAVVFQLNSGEISHAVRRQVAPGVTQLVEQLLLDDGAVHAASRVFMLGDMKGAVRTGLDNGKTDIGEIGNGLPINLAISSRGLRPAFNDVAGDGPGRQPVGIIRAPAEFVHHGSQSQSRIGRTSRDDDLSARLQRFDQRKGSQVDIGAQDLGPDLSNGVSAVQVIESDASRDHLVEPAENVVTQDDGDLGATDSIFTCRFDDSPGAFGWVDSAGIRDDLDVSLQQLRENSRRERNEVAGIARAWDHGPFAFAGWTW